MRIGNYNMEISRLIEILNGIKIELESDPAYTQTGICQALRRIQLQLRISFEESCFVSRFLLCNKPTKDNEYSEFTDTPYWGKPNSDFWWQEICTFPETKQFRVGYLNKLISNVKQYGS